MDRKIVIEIIKNYGDTISDDDLPLELKEYPYGFPEHDSVKAFPFLDNGTLFEYTEMAWQSDQTALAVDLFMRAVEILCPGESLPGSFKSTVLEHTPGKTLEDSVVIAFSHHCAIVLLDMVCRDFKMDHFETFCVLDKYFTAEKLSCRKTEYGWPIVSGKIPVPGTPESWAGLRHRVYEMIGHCLLLIHVSRVTKFYRPDDLLAHVLATGNISVAEKLCEMGADIDYHYGYPLRLASMNGNLRGVKFLLDRGAQDIHMPRRVQEPDIFDYLEPVDGTRNLVMLHDKYHVAGSIMEEKMLREMDLCCKLKHERALTCAAYSGNVEVMRLLTKKPFVNDSNRDHRIPALICASAMGHVSAVEYLISLGVDVDAWECDALTRACRNKHHAVISLLVDRVSDINANQGSAFRWAARSGDLETVDLLYQRGADPMVREGYAYTQSAMMGMLDVVKYLDTIAEFKPFLDIATVRACIHPDAKLEMVKYLVDAGAQIDPNEFINSVPRPQIINFLLDNYEISEQVKDSLLTRLCRTDRVDVDLVSRLISPHTDRKRLLELLCASGDCQALQTFYQEDKLEDSHFMAAIESGKMVMLRLVENLAGKKLASGIELILERGHLEMLCHYIEREIFNFENYRTRGPEICIRWQNSECLKYLLQYQYTGGSKKFKRFIIPASSADELQLHCLMDPPLLRYLVAYAPDLQDPEGINMGEFIESLTCMARTNNEQNIISELQICGIHADG